jgi:glycosyltransferase involved in cell wall biosynthesis
MSAPTDISIILNVHREVPFLRATLQSLSHCLQEASSANLTCELVVVFDRSDRATKRVFEQWSHQEGSQLTRCAIHTLEVSLGSLAQARNAGIQQATGEYVWTADADDLTSRNALVELHRLARSLGAQKVAFYLEYMVLFGTRYHINKYANSSKLTVADFCFEHPYVSRIFLRRECLLHHAYRHMEEDCGYAFEDWDLVCRLKRDEYSFFVAPETILFYRQRQGSIMNFTPKTSILPPSHFFEPGWLPGQLARDLGPDRNYAVFVAGRSDRTDRDFATELQQSQHLQNFLLETCALDPEMEYEKVITSSSWFVLDHPGHHLGHKLAELFGLVGRLPFTDVIFASSSHPDDPESLAMSILSSLVNRHAETRLLVIALEPAHLDRWLDQMPQNTVVVDLFHLFPGLDPHDRDRLTLRLALSSGLRDARLHLLPGESCHRLMADFGTPLLCHFQGLYYRCHDPLRTVQGRSLVDPAALHFLRQHLARLAFVIFNGTAMLEADQLLLGLSAEICLVLCPPGEDRQQHMPEDEVDRVAGILERPFR